MLTDITHRGALPAYLKISEAIARDIGAGRLPDGTRLPTERQMAQDYNVAVGTLRKALAELEANGLLERRQGSGNYIRHSPAAPSIYALFRLERPDGGGLPTARMLDVTRMKKDPALPDFGPSKDAFRFRRLRYLDDLPVAIEEIWLDGARAETIAADDISESLYHFYKQELGFWIGRAEDRISTAPVPDWKPGNFRPYIGSISGFITRVAWDQDDTPVETSRTWYDPERAVYSAQLS